MTSIRVIGEEELPALVAIANAAQPRERADVTEYVDWRNQAKEMVWLLAEDEGEAVGAGYALTGWHTPPYRGIAAALVAPPRRGAGVGDALLAALESWSRSRGITELEGPVAEDEAVSLAWAGARGYVEVGRNSRLVLDLTQTEAPAPDPPPGIDIVAWSERPEVARGLWEVAREASPDIPGEDEWEVAPFEEWLRVDMQGAGDDPRAVFVALAGEEVVGYAKLSFSEATLERAYHDLTGVRRAWRGKGVAAALKRTQIAWAKANGYATLQTSNEVRNEPIRHLNQKHGYVLEPGVVIVRRTIVAT